MVAHSARLRDVWGLQCLHWQGHSAAGMLPFCLLMHPHPAPDQCDRVIRQFHISVRAMRTLQAHSNQFANFGLQVFGICQQELQIPEIWQQLSIGQACAQDVFNVNNMAWNLQQQLVDKSMWICLLLQALFSCGKNPKHGLLVACTKRGFGFNAYTTYLLQPQEHPYRCILDLHVPKLDFIAALSPQGRIRFVGCLAALELGQH